MPATINLRHDRTEAEEKAVAQLAADNGMTYCRTCLDGCHHGTHGGCGHYGCWGPDSTNDCGGIPFAKVAYKL